MLKRRSYNRPRLGPRRRCMAASGGEDRSGAAAGYSLPGAEVAVELADAPLQRWLDEFLLPGFDRCTAIAGAPKVVVTSAARSPQGADDLGLQPCFALDQHVLEHPAGRI